MSFYDLLIPLRLKTVVVNFALIRIQEFVKIHATVTFPDLPVAPLIVHERTCC